MTHYLDHLQASCAEAARILAKYEIKSTPATDHARATEAEAAAEMIIAVAGCMDRLLSSLISDADAEIGALTETERKDSYRIVTDAVEGTWDYAFQRFAASVWEGAPAAGYDRIGAFEAGVRVGRAA